MLIKYFTGKEKIDMVRIKNILERNILEYLSSLESSPHEAIAFLIIGDVLYGNTVEDVCCTLKALENLFYCCYFSVRYAFECESSTGTFANG